MTDENGLGELEENARDHKKNLDRLINERIVSIILTKKFKIHKFRIQNTFEKKNLLMILV